MELRIDPKIAETFSSVCIGVLVARGVISTSNPEIDGLLKDEEVRVRDNFDPETFQQDSRLQAWREAYRLFGTKPRDGKSSIENLIRIVLSGRALKRVNTLVDLYNLISLKYVLPVGGEDIDQIKGVLQLRFAAENEAPALLLGDTEPTIPAVGEVFYCDDLGAVCRKWNWREADRTKLSDQTKNAVFVLEGLAPITCEHVSKATAELSSLVQKYCGGVCKTAILNNSNLACLL